MEPAIFLSLIDRWCEARNRPAGIVLGGDLDVVAISPLDQFYARGAGSEGFEQIGPVSFEGRGRCPGFRRPAARKVGNDRPGAQPIFQSRSERTVGPLFPGRDNPYGIKSGDDFGDGLGISETATEYEGIIFGR